MSTHAPFRPSSSLPWVFATCLGACVGTPTPEPPDNLPRPDETHIFGTRIEVDVLSMPTRAVSIPVTGSAGAVAPNSELWIVNLDGTDAPRSIRAAGNGAFGTEVSGLPGDRIRLVARTDERHSLPLDATVARAGVGMFGLAQLPPSELACLSLAPADDLTTVVSQGHDVTRSFVLSSRCAEPVQIESASLRFGDAGFVLHAPSGTLAPNQSVALELTITGHDDDREHTDIVLLDVSSGAQIGRYALGVWSVAASSIGKD